MHHVLICAATRAEHDACRRGVDAFGYSPAISHDVIRTGVGPSRAGRSLAERLARGPLPDLVISTGFAGALGRTPPLFSWMSAASVAAWRGAERDVVSGVILVEGPPDFVRSDVLSSSELVMSAAHADLDVNGDRPVVVDMESAALARAAGERGVPFAVLRMISDTPAHPLPSFMTELTAALAADSSARRFSHGARGLGGLVTDPRGAMRLVTEGPAWLRRLEAGWIGLAAWSAARATDPRLRA